MAAERLADGRQPPLSARSELGEQAFRGYGGAKAPTIGPCPAGRFRPAPFDHNQMVRLVKRDLVGAGLGGEIGSQKVGRVQTKAKKRVEDELAPFSLLIELCRIGTGKNRGCFAA